VRPFRNHTSCRGPDARLEAPTHRIRAFPSSQPLPQTIPQRHDASFSRSKVPSSAKQNPIKNQHCGSVHRTVSSACGLNSISLDWLSHTAPVDVVVSSACGLNSISLAQLRRPQAEETYIGHALSRIL
jgi:hypothetical protein